MTDLIYDTLSGEWPTFGLLGLCVVLFVYAVKQRPPWQALAGVACYAAALVLMSLYYLWPSGTDEMLHARYDIWGTGIGLALIVYLPVMFVAFVLFPPPRRHGLVVLIWLMVIVAEVWTGLMENVNCNFWQTDIPFDLQTPEQRDMSKCERIYGSWYSYVPLLAQILLMFGAVVLFGWAKAINRRLREVR